MTLSRYRAIHLSMTDNHFTEQLPCDVVIPGVANIIKTVRAVDDGFNALLRHHTDHVLQITAATNHNGLKTSEAEEHGHEFNTAFRAPQDADQGDLAAICHSLDRLRQRTGSTDLHDSVDTASGS